MKKKALIFGIAGEDGSCLVKELLKKNYSVFGVTKLNKLNNLQKLSILNKASIYTLKKFTEKKIIAILKKRFDTIYFFGVKSKINQSFANDKIATGSNVVPVKIILEFIRNHQKTAKFLFASSGEIFGNQGFKKLNENSEKMPLSPYGLSKLMCFEMIKSYREMFKLKVCSLIFFNHESCLRDNAFVVSKIIKNLISIKKNKKGIVNLGNINTMRDWGWAPEYMKIVTQITKKNKFDDYVIATGKTVSIKRMVYETCKQLGIKVPKIKSKNQFKRKFDIKKNFSNINKLKKHIHNYPKLKFNQVIRKIINNEL